MLGLILLLVFKVCSSIDVEAISGSTTTLTCPLQGSSFQWQRFVNSDWSRLQQAAKYGNVNTTSLIIYNVDPGDDGSYLCRADSQPTYNIIQDTVIVIAIEGSTATLTCPLQGFSFTWLKPTNYGWSILQQGAKYRNVNTGYLAIYDVDPHDGGTYLCATGSQQLEINIVFRAIAIWGSNTTLTCILPGPNYYWQKRMDSGWSSQIQAGAKYGNVYSGSMTIYNVQTNDGGRYRCGNNSTLEQVDAIVRVASEDDNSSATIGIGAGIGSTAVVVGLLIVFIYILKRYRLRKPAESTIYDTTGDTGSSSSDLHIYNGLQQNTESPTHRQNDVIYVNTNI